jgi:hypothetical protein
LPFLPPSSSLKMPSASAQAAVNVSQCVSNTIPLTQVIGRTYQVNVTFKNTGTNTWSPAHQILPTPYSQTGRTLNISHLLPSREKWFPQVRRSQKILLLLPRSVPGIYSAQYQMVQSGVARFGALCGPSAVVVRVAKNCTFNGQTVADGASVTAYQTNSVPTGSVCASQTRTCNDSTLLGSYAYASCTVGTPPPPPPCQKIQHKSSLMFERFLAFRISMAPI